VLKAIYDSGGKLMNKYSIAKGSLLLGVILLLLAVYFVPIFAAITPIDFTGFTGSGFTPSPAAGQLDSDIWRTTGFDTSVAFGGTCTSGDCARGSSTGGVSTGGVYAFNVGGGNIALGVQPGGSDFTPGDFTLKVENTTGSTIANIYISYTIWVYNDQPRANSFNFSYSTDDTSYTSVSALDYTSPAAADSPASWNSVNRVTTLTSINLADGAFLYLKWTGNDVSGGGSRDEFALDDIEVRNGGPTAITLSSLSAHAATPWTGIALAGLLLGALVLVRRKR